MQLLRAQTFVERHYGRTYEGHSVFFVPADFLRMDV